MLPVFSKLSESFNLYFFQFREIRWYSFFPLNGCIQFNELIVFMGFWKLNVHDYIFKVLIMAVMELRTVGLGLVGKIIPWLLRKPV